MGFQRTLMVAFCIGCTADATQPIILRFDAEVDGVQTGCQPVRDVDPSPLLGTPPTVAQFADARMLVSQVEFQDVETGDWVALDAPIAFPWRNQGITLLDFESADALCSATGTPIVNKNLSGTLPTGDYRGLRFSVGAPFEANHVAFERSDAASFEEDMFVDVRHGYRFIRLDWAVEGRFNRRFRLDVGNLGCDDATPVTCERENLAQITLPDFVPGTHAISVNLGALMATVDLTQVEADVPAGCSLVAEDALTECDGALEALGLSPDSGECAGDCDGQTVFGLNDFAFTPDE